MKIGLEVEGYLVGTPTLFCSAEDLPKINAVYNQIKNRSYVELGNKKISHIYISDHSNVITCNDLIGLPNVRITLEVTKYLLSDRPDNVDIMLRDPTFTYVDKLKLIDMIKFELDRKVYVFSMRDAVKTLPHEFDKDVELNV